jgi:hypothetical protein
VPVVGAVSCGIVTDEPMGTELEEMGRTVGRAEGGGREEMVTRMREDEVGMLE